MQAFYTLENSFTDNNIEGATYIWSRPINGPIFVWKLATYGQKNNRGSAQPRCCVFYAMINNTRNVVHLQITQSTVSNSPLYAFHFSWKFTCLQILRVVIYVQQEKTEWYNSSDVHSKLLNALYPIIVDHILAEEQGKSVQKRKKELENTRIVNHGTWQIRL